ncbi:MAG: DUF1566 domain-containing protein, partial [Legionella sp.]|nr:DUF1566 domain-containing protein [Legionella sp.]
ARTITITNNSGSTVTIGSVSAPSPSLPSGTTVDTSQANACVPGLALANGGICTLTIAPGSTVSTGAGSALCTTGIAPTPSAITVMDSNSNIVTVNVVVLGYGCQYQGGYLFSIDDTTPAIGSIGGKVAASQDQAHESQNTIFWSPNFAFDSIWGIAQVSTTTTPIPNASYFQPAALHSDQLNCNGSTDGACDSNNMIQFYVAGTSYSAWFCAQPIDSIGNSPCSTGTCYTDWYLPAICEMGYDTVGLNSGCGVPPAAPLLQNMQSNLVDNGNIGSLTGNYWSSTETSSPLDNAWFEFFASSGGSAQRTSDKSYSYSIRCSRALTL